MIATTPFVWLKQSEIPNLEGDIVWDNAVSAEPLDGYIPLHPYKELNIDYKKEWVLAQKQSKVYESWWIQYRDMAVKLDKELTEAGHMIGVLREYISDLENGLESSIKLNKAQAERQEK
jgi:hypothetical protein